MFNILGIAVFLLDVHVDYVIDQTKPKQDKNTKERPKKSCSILFP